jgi:hypothetical protein
MRARPVQTGIARRLGGRRRLERVCTSARLFLMVVTTPPALAEAARFSGRPTSPCSKLVKAQSPVAVSTLESLSKNHAQHVATVRQKWQELPWHLALGVERTLHQRASLHPATAKTFQHGQGWVVGHPWTHIVLRLHALLMPRRPIPFSRQRYGRAHGLAYGTEQDLVVDDLQTVTLADESGSSDPREVVVVTARGDDQKKLPPAIADQPGPCLIALGKTRRVHSAMCALTTPKAKPWWPMATFLRQHRRLPWHTIRSTTHGTQRQRMALRP